MKVVAAASVLVGVLGWLGPEVLEDALGGSGSCCRRGAELGLGLVFLLRAEAVEGRVAARRPSWISAGLWARISLRRGLWRRRGCLRLGGVWRPLRGFPRGFGGDVLDEGVVVVADEVVVVLEVVESKAQELAVGDGGGP